MIRYSVIIPQQDRSDDVRRQLPALVAALDRLAAPYEIIVVDDGSAPAQLRLLEKLLPEFSSLRLLRLDQPVGTSVALTAAIRAARGEVIIAVEPGEAYPPPQIAALIEGLQRADFLAGRRRLTRLAKLRHRIARLPRWLLLGLDGHDPDCLFWAARREVFSDVVLPAGAARYLPALVVRRGFRVCEMYVDDRGSRRRLQDVRASVGDLLAAWWNCRRWRNAAAYELKPGRTAQSQWSIVEPPEVSATGAVVLPFDPPRQLAADLNYPTGAVKHA